MIRINIKKGIRTVVTVSGYNNVRVFLFFLAAAFVAHIDKFILGPYAFFKTHDQFDSLWPFQVALTKRLLSFQFPGWLPDYVGGLPFFYMDINWLFLPMIIGGLFKDPWSAVAITMLQFVLAGFGAYLFLKHFFHTDKEIGILGGIMWALATFNLTYWRICDLAVLPMLLYCTDQIRSSQNKKERLWLLFGLFISATNVYISKGALFIAFFQLFFIFFSNSEWRARRKVFVAYCFFWLFVLVLNLPLVLSLLASATETSRGLIREVPAVNPAFFDYIRVFHPPFMLLPAMHLGIIGALIFFYGLFCFRQWDRITRAVFFFLIAISLFSVFEQTVWVQTLRAGLPLKAAKLSRFVLPGPFIVFIIAISNFKSFLIFLQGPFKKIFIFTIFIAAMLGYLHLTKHQFPQTYIEALVCLLFAVIFLVGIAVLKKRNVKQLGIIYFILCLIFAERLVNHNLTRMADSYPPSFKYFFQSEIFDKFRPEHKHDYRIAFINWHPAVGLYNNYQVAGGFSSQYLRRYQVFWTSVGEGFLSYYHKAYLIDEKVERETYPPHIIRDIAFRTDLLALNNVRYIFSFYEIEKPERWGLSLAHRGTAPYRAAGWRRYPQTILRAFQSIDYFVYEIQEFSPRIYLTDNFILADDTIGLKKYLDTSKKQFLRTHVIYDKQDLSPSEIVLLASLDKSNGVAGRARAKIVYYSDNKIVIDVNSSVSQQLVLIENYLDEWSAKINGRPAAILPAYGVFRSVVLNKGENQVIFEYRPAYLVNSLWISGLGSMLFIVFGIFWALRSHKNDNQAE